MNSTPASTAPHRLPWQARLIRASLRLLALLPLSVLRLLAQLLTPLVSRLPLRENHVARRNIARCLPELDARSAAALHHASVKHLLMSLFELPLIWTQPWQNLKKLILSVEGEAAFVQAIHDAKERSRVLDDSIDLTVRTDHERDRIVGMVIAWLYVFVLLLYCSRGFPISRRKILNVRETIVYPRFYV